MTISKGQAMAPVGQTASHSRHHPQSSVSTTITTLPTMTKARQSQTPRHSPQPLHLSRSNAGIIANFVPPNFLFYLIGKTNCLSVTFVSTRLRYQLF